jgi:hypothetical protein
MMAKCSMIMKKSTTERAGGGNTRPNTQNVVGTIEQYQRITEQIMNHGFLTDDKKKKILLEIEEAVKRLVRREYEFGGQNYYQFVNSSCSYVDINSDIIGIKLDGRR